MEINIVRIDGAIDTHTISEHEATYSNIRRIMERGVKVKPIATLTIRGSNYALIYTHNGERAFLCMVEKLYVPFCSRIFYNQNGKFDRSIFFGSKDDLDNGEYLLLRHEEVNPMIPTDLESVEEVLMYAKDMTHYFSTRKRNPSNE